MIQCIRHWLRPRISEHADIRRPQIMVITMPLSIICGLLVHFDYAGKWTAFIAMMLLVFSFMCMLEASLYGPMQEDVD